MRLDGIDVFVEVVNAKGFSRAAKRLGVPSTTVSAKVKRLEERLGVTLLQRTTRRLSLTDAGERFFAHCARALDEVAQAERALTDQAGEPAGRLRLTAPADIAQTVLVPVIAAYLDRYPAVTIELQLSNRYVDLVGEGIDLAIRIGDMTSSSLITRRYISSDFALWAAGSYLAQHGQPESLRDLASHRFIALRTTRQNAVLTDGKVQINPLHLNACLRVDDMRTCQSLAENGLGIVLLPKFAMAATAGLVPVLPQVRGEEFSVSFLYPRQSFVPLTVRSFIDLALHTSQRG